MLGHRWCLQILEHRQAGKLYVHLLIHAVDCAINSQMCRQSAAADLQFLLKVSLCAYSLRRPMHQKKKIASQASFETYSFGSHNNATHCAIEPFYPFHFEWMANVKQASDFTALIKALHV